VEVDTSDSSVRAAYIECINTEISARRKLLGRLSVDEISFVTEHSSVGPLLKFFRNREHQRRR
jgi:hypothetical protein